MTAVSLGRRDNVVASSEPIFQSLAEISAARLESVSRTLKTAGPM